MLKYCKWSTVVVFALTFQCGQTEAFCLTSAPRSIENLLRTTMLTAADSRDQNAIRIVDTFALCLPLLLRFQPIPATVLRTFHGSLRFSMDLGGISHTVGYPWMSA